MGTPAVPLAYARAQIALRHQFREGKMTTYARRNAQHESGEWVVDTATGRIVRRERPLLVRVRSVPSLGTLDGALAIEHAFADLRVFCLADEPQTLPEPPGGSYEP